MVLPLVTVTEPLVVAYIPYPLVPDVVTVPLLAIEIMPVDVSAQIPLALEPVVVIVLELLIVTVPVPPV